MSMLLTITAGDSLVPNDRIEEMIQAAVEGDRSALEGVIAAVERRVYTLAWRLIGDPTAAEDITQEVLVRIAANLKRYRRGSNLWAWIYRITVNQSHDYRRVHEVRAVVAPVPESPNPETDERVARIQQALSILTMKEREALLLLEVEGYSSREAASILGTLPITVRTRAAQARKKVRKHLSRFYPELGESHE